MAYSCPRCGKPVQRGSNTAAGVAGGAVGALIFAAFGSFQCQKCGPIPKSEFPADVQTKMTLGSVFMVLIALLLLIAVVVLLVYLRTQ